MSLEVLIAGNSHVAAMGVAKADSDEVSISEISISHIGLDGKVRFLGVSGPRQFKNDGRYWNALSAQCKDRLVALSWKGNQHIESFLFRSDKLFDFYLPGEGENVLHGSVVVPAKVIRAHFRPSLSTLPKIIADLHEGGARAVFLLGTPPPKENDEVILARLRKSSHFMALARKMSVNLESSECLTPPTVRIKLWKILQDMMNELALSCNAQFISVPNKTQKESGALREEYWSGDVTHANQLYGKEMLSLISMKSRDYADNL